MGRPVFYLLPGMLCDARLWQHQVAAFQKDYILRVPDLSYQDSVTAMAESVLDQAPSSFRLAGLSMGGYVALEIMRLAPERVEQLVLIATSARPDTPAQRAHRQGLLRLAEKGRFQGVTPRLLPSILHKDHVDKPEAGGLVMEMAASLGRSVYMAQQRAVMARRDQRDILPKIFCPVLVVCGEDDSLTPPEWSQEMANLLPNARFSLIKRCGHLPPLEQPEQLNYLLSR